LVRRHDAFFIVVVVVVAVSRSCLGQGGSLSVTVEAWCVPAEREQGTRVDD
jgi:hypothetical protein